MYATELVGLLVMVFLYTMKHVFYTVVASKKWLLMIFPYIRTTIRTYRRRTSIQHRII